MNLTFLILCINAVAATAHNHHLRQKPGHHDMVFRATESDLRRLLKGTEKASNQDLEALEVLRGSERFLKGCDEDKDCENGGKCDIKTGETEGDCKCKKGYKGDTCDVREIEVTIVVKNMPDENSRSAVCQEAVDNLEDVKIPKTMPADNSKGHRTRDRRLTSNKGPLKVVVELDGTSCNDRDADGNELLDQLTAQLNSQGIELKGNGHSRDI